MNAGMLVKGEMTLIRRDLAGKLIGMSRMRRNAFEAAGLAEVAKRLAGAGTAWTRADLALRLNKSDNTSEVVTHATNGVTVASQVVGQSLVISVTDARGTAYALGGSGLQPQLGAGGSPLASYSTFDATTWNNGAKPATEVWTYRWTVTISGAEQGGQNVTWDPNVGLSMARRLHGDLAGAIEVHPTATDGTMLGAVPAFGSELNLRHDGEGAGDADGVNGAVVTLKRHRDAGSAFSCTGERLQFDSSNPYCVIFPRDAVAAGANVPLNFTHVITIAAAP